MAAERRSGPTGHARLDELIAEGKATYLPGRPGPLPVLRLKKPVKDLQKIIREAKGC